ncbi:MAG: hypothetical protein WD801_14430 [Gemmatimonadaceae bacterium]
MHHRHLLPNEIDLLLDEETGFGVQPLREHVHGCEECRVRLAESRAVADSLSALPTMAPRIGMSDRVMARVPVFVPWDVAARDAVQEWVPTGPAARAIAAVLVAVVGTLVTGLTLWIATRGDLIAMLTGLAGEGILATATGVFDEFVLALFGPQVIQSVQLVGPIGIALAAGGFLLAMLATVLGLRRIATSGRARS